MHNNYTCIFIKLCLEKCPCCHNNTSGNKVQEVQSRAVGTKDQTIGTEGRSRWVTGGSGLNRGCWTGAQEVEMSVSWVNECDSHDHKNNKEKKKKYENNTVVNRLYCSDRSSPSNNSHIKHQNEEKNLSLTVPLTRAWLLVPVWVFQRPLSFNSF